MELSQPQNLTPLGILIASPDRGGQGKGYPAATFPGEIQSRKCHWKAEKQETLLVLPL